MITLNLPPTTPGNSSQICWHQTTLNPTRTIFENPDGYSLITITVTKTRECVRATDIAAIPITPIVKLKPSQIGH